MAAFSNRSRPIGSSRRIASRRFRSLNPAATPAGETPLQDHSAAASQAEVASRQDLALRLEGRRLGNLRGGKLKIVCGCGHSGDVPVPALVARHGEEARVGDAIASMRCGTCGARRVTEVRWLD